MMMLSDLNLEPIILYLNAGYFSLLKILGCRLIDSASNIIDLTQNKIRLKQPISLDEKIV